MVLHFWLLTWVDAILNNPGESSEIGEEVEGADCEDYAASGVFEPSDNGAEQQINYSIGEQLKARGSRQSR